MYRDKHSVQATEQEAAQKNLQLGAWGISDSFRLNHLHKEAGVFKHAATAEPVHLELSFLRQPGHIRVEVRKEYLS